MLLADCAPLAANWAPLAASAAEAAGLELPSNSERLAVRLVWAVGLPSLEIAGGLGPLARALATTLKFHGLSRAALQPLLQECP